MVRADHEDGGVLNSDDDRVADPAEPEAKRSAPVVKKSSPLGRKSKARTATAGKKAEPARKRAEKSAIPGFDPQTPAPIPGIGEDRADADDSDDVENVAEDSEAEDSEADGAADVEAVDADTAADSAAVGYRDRRVATQRRRTAREAAESAKKSRAATSLRPADQRTALWVVGLCIGTVVLVAGTVLSIFFGMRYAQIQDERELRAEFATFARQVVVQMTTLDAENADNMYKLAMEKTSGRAQQVFRDNMKTVAELIRQGDAETKTTVLTEAVSKATPDEGEVLMVVGWEHRSKNAEEAPLFQTFRYQVGMTRLNGELKVTELEFVW